MNRRSILLAAVGAPLAGFAPKVDVARAVDEWVRWRKEQILSVRTSRDGGLTFFMTIALAA